ncbi:thiamine diphosphate-binding protein [Amylocystis lapponica]|nr:thiamine diphosphate-binding protein [Amylocystis lapponica]
MYTGASVLFKTLADAGITHAFVNWGNDHPALLEELERQRVEYGKTSLAIVTCPNEMVALSAAQGYAQVTYKPAAVIVHVDVGTQALAAAVHNVDRGHTPVFIFAGAAPFSAGGELRGSKNEYPMWWQDVPDQSAIVRQYMRHTAQVQSGRTMGRSVMRALQFTTSMPRGPVYLWARREITEEEVEDSAMSTALSKSQWPSVEPAGLSSLVVDTIVSALVVAKFPLIITASTGRNPRTVPLLTALSELHAIPIFAACPQTVNIPYNHHNLIGSSFEGKNPSLSKADTIIVFDTDIPWAETAGNTFLTGARTFVIDADPLKRTFGWTHVDAEMICAADAEVALTQLLDGVRRADVAARPTVETRGREIEALHNAWRDELHAVEAAALASDGTTPRGARVLGVLRDTVRAKTPSGGRNVFWLNEGISHCEAVWSHIQPETEGSMVMSGASGLGWALGAAVGARLGGHIAQKDFDLIVAVVGDGAFLFGVPSSAFWIARRYNTPFLTVILNNGGWVSPKKSMMGVHPHGHGSKVSGHQLTVGFGPELPDYAGIASAAGGAWGRRVERADELQAALEEGIRVVVEEKRSAVVDCIIEQI